MNAPRSSAAIARRFQKLLASLAPNKTEVARTAKHFATVRKALKRRYEVVRAIRIGSHAKGTAIANFSDLDMLVVLRRPDLEWGRDPIQPTTLLDWIRSDLAVSFPRTKVRRDGMAVTLAFGGGAYAMDVVPALYVGHHDRGRPLYAIPTPDGGWRSTSPEAHTLDFQTRDRQGGRR